MSLKLAVGKCICIQLLFLLSFIVKAEVLNDGPVIFIQTLSGGSQYVAPASVFVHADAYAPNGIITKVEFYLCSTKIAEVDSEPYEIIIKGLTAGDYCITAKATNHLDSTTESNPISVHVDEAIEDCENISTYIENGGYLYGSQVKNGGHRYECKSWPYSGWCNGASWAYAPGTGSSWQDAWIDLGACSADSSCMNIPEYIENGGYGPESEVINEGIRYACKPWPYSGWCNGAAWAYEPGLGSSWQDAWIELGSCSSNEFSRATMQTKVELSPHPFETYTKVRLENNEEIVSLALYNTNGVKIMVLEELNKQEIILNAILSSGYYVLHVTTKKATYTKAFVKR